MTNKLEEKNSLDNDKSKQPLTVRQKLLFGMVCWGVQSWGQAKKFKALGYDQKYIDARKSMYTGIVIYSISFIIFILLLLLKGN